MSGRTYCNHEIMQWGYVALVCIALAFTSITRAAASTKPSDYRPEGQATSNLKGDACFPNSGVGEVPDGKMGETKGDFTRAEPISKAFGSSLVNTKLDPGNDGSSLSSPLHQCHAD